MKSLLILILLVALAAAAVFTRPSKDNFTDYIVAQSTKGDGNVFSKGFDRMRAESFAKNCDFTDRLLWVDVQQDGQTIYTGAFNHWFNRAQVKNSMNAIEQKVSDAGHSVGKGIEAMKH